jgi:hypothetical protein
MPVGSVGGGVYDGGWKGGDTEEITKERGLTILQLPGWRLLKRN